MEKPGSFNPKALANRLRSKGLQKLRWYCQLCQKQCRDENGFKCHCLSASHQRQLLLASENPQQFVDHFSEEFRKDFLALLRRRFGTKRVHHNVVYNEYVRRREHVHMNATRWETLTDWTKWLGREGYCKVDETPDGWYLQYIERDPEATRRQQERKKKAKRDLDDEEKTARLMEERVRRGLEGKEQEAPVYTGLSRENDKEKVVFTLHKGASRLLGPSALEAPTVKRKEIPPASGQAKEKRRKTAAPDGTVEFEGEKTQQPPRTHHWLQPDIVVKIMTKELGEKYHQKKAVVQEVLDKYTALVQLMDSGDKLKLDQSHLQTVIPAPGKKVLVLNGAYRGHEVTLEGISEETFSATIFVESGPLKGLRVAGMPYEDISKRA